MTMFYSKSENGFFRADHHAGNMPADAKPIPDNLYQSLIIDLRSGAQLFADVNGNPVAAFPEPQSAAELLEIAKAEMRPRRAEMLDALTGIAGRAARAGNDDLASEADLLAKQLLDITDDPALNAATTYEAMQAAGIAAYRRIAGNSSPALASVFKEITGA